MCVASNENLEQVLKEGFDYKGFCAIEMPIDYRQKIILGKILLNGIE